MTKVLINGIGGELGAQVAQRLSKCSEVAVIGLGRQNPPAPVGRADWLVARLTGHQLVELLRAEGVDTVVHLEFLGADAPPGDREAAVQQNVLGSMELLGACLAAGVRHVVIRSHTGVYGASPTNPTLIDEGQPVAHTGLSGVVRDMAEVEQFIADFAPRHPDLTVATLRCAPIIDGWSPLISYLTQPTPRMIFGFDPIIQLVQISDAAEAFVRAALTPMAGAFNIAADDTLRLSQAIRLAGRQPVSVLEPLLGNQKTAIWPFDRTFLRYGCIGDTRRAKKILGWSPACSAAEALQALRTNGHAIEDRATSEAALRAFLERKS